ncbi:MAG: ABC transporter permease [Alphaproteobacteria bacterium]|nr:ABC transporter permease [Alphaproteobacteria bacterium]
MTDSAELHIARSGEGLDIRIAGGWTVAAAAGVDARLRALEAERPARARFELGGLSTLDTAGAFLLCRTIGALEAAGVRVEVGGVAPRHRLLLETVAAARRPPLPPEPRINPALRILAGIGEATAGIGAEFMRLLGFTGIVVETLGRTLLRPGRLRVVSLVHHMEQAGLNAVPIIALITFLIGAVVTFLGSDILTTFGAEVYTINLLAFAFLREFGVLLAAIMVAGRSGSAFTAQIGSMRAREEVDAMQTLGLDPIEVLVLPRLIALVIALPLLTVVGDLAGIAGGLIVSWAMLDMTPWLFIARLTEVAEARHFLAGLIKAPFFAFVIATIGCFQGLLVEGTAESVGRRTTLSVVEAIFLVIVLDAAFAIFFIEVGW